MFVISFHFSPLLSQAKLARLRNFVKHYKPPSEQSQSRPDDSSAVPKGVFRLGRCIERLDLSRLSLSKLNKMASCIVDSLLILNSKTAAEVQRTIMDVPGSLQASIAVPIDDTFTGGLADGTNLPRLSKEACSLLFTMLCVNGAPRLHASACALLVQLVGSRPWWGRFVCETMARLFGETQSAVFDKEK